MDIGNLNGGEEDGLSSTGSHNRHSHGCCQDNAAADFSLLTMPGIHAVDFTKLNLWLTIFLVSMDPFYKPVIAVMEYKTQLLSQAVGKAFAFDLYAFCGFLHSTLALFSFISTLKEQPLYEYFQSNTILLFAYGLLLFGLGLKSYTCYYYRWKKLLGERYFKPVNVSTREGKNPLDIAWRPYYHPNGTASVLCLVAVSLLGASLAGIVICVLFALAYITAYHTEWFLLRLDWSVFMKEAQFTKIRAGKVRFMSDSCDLKKQ